MIFDPFKKFIVQMTGSELGSLYSSVFSTTPECHRSLGMLHMRSRNLTVCPVFGLAFAGSLRAGEERHCGLTTAGFVCLLGSDECHVLKFSSSGELKFGRTKSPRMTCTV